MAATSRRSARVYLGGEPAARAAYGLAVLPPLPLEAQRCACTAEEPISICVGGPPAMASAVKMSRHMLRRPALEMVVKRLSRAVDQRRITPAPATLDNMDDATDHAAVVDARLAPCVSRRMRLQLRRLLVTNSPESFEC